MATDFTNAILYLGDGGKVSDLVPDVDDAEYATDFIENVQHDEVGVSENVDSYHIYVSADYDTGQDLNHTLEALDARVTDLEP